MEPITVGILSSICFELLKKAGSLTIDSIKERIKKRKPDAEFSDQDAKAICETVNSYSEEVKNNEKFIKSNFEDDPLIISIVEKLNSGSNITINEVKTSGSNSHAFGTVNGDVNIGNTTINISEPQKKS